MLRVYTDYNTVHRVDYSYPSNESYNFYETKFWNILRICRTRLRIMIKYKIWKHSKNRLDVLDVRDSVKNLKHYDRNIRQPLHGPQCCFSYYCLVPSSFFMTSSGLAEARKTRLRPTLRRLWFFSSSSLSTFYYPFLNLCFSQPSSTYFTP